MRIPKHSHDLIRQNEKIVKKPQKHDANLQKNTTLYFQIGLIVCLLFTYAMLEMKFQTTIPEISKYEVDPIDLNEIAVEKFKIYEDPQTKDEVKPEEKKVILNKEPKIVDDETVIKKALDINTAEQNNTTDKPLSSDDIKVIDKPEDINVSIAFIQDAPVYPGCENANTNEDRKKCMSEKIGALIRSKFRGSDIASDYGLQGRQNIRTQFKIDKFGKITDVKVGGPHPKLEDEAKRVINLIPKMKPGKQNDKHVGVIYTLPIVFQVEY